MIPNVFVSSTVRDLQHLRDSVRDCISDLGYNPVMSDYGEIGYLPDQDAEHSCYTAMSQCHLAILIIGKRYSEPTANDVSVTENEYRTARAGKIPTITLVDREVMAFKRVFEVNTVAKKSVEFPGMDHPASTFKFIENVASSPWNNGILEFGTGSEARKAIKQQLAHLFGELLNRRHDPVKGEVKDILTEIKTLRREIGKKPSPQTRHYTTLVRFLLDDTNSTVRDALRVLDKDEDQVVRHLGRAKNWVNLLRKLKVHSEISDDPAYYEMGRAPKIPLKFTSHTVTGNGPVSGSELAKFSISYDGKFYCNRAALSMLDEFVIAAKEQVKAADARNRNK